MCGSVLQWIEGQLKSLSVSFLGVQVALSTAGQTEMHLRIRIVLPIGDASPPRDIIVVRNHLVR